MLHLVEELVGESEGVLDADGIANALGEALLVALHTAAALLVESLSFVQILGGADAVGESSHCCLISLAQDEVVVDELFHAAEVDSVVIFFGDNQVEDVDVELAARLEVGDDELHVSTAQDVWCSGGHGGNLSSEKGRGGVQGVKTDKGID